MRFNQGGFPKINGGIPLPLLSNLLGGLSSVAMIHILSKLGLQFLLRIDFCCVLSRGMVSKRSLYRELSVEHHHK